MEISRLALVYTTEGADKAQRADEKVRKSVKETGRTARKEEGSTKRWMQQNKLAMAAIAAAVAGAAYAIIKSSPSMAVAFDEIKMGFSMMAMEIGEVLAPVIGPIADAVWWLSDAFAGLPGPVRAVIVVAGLFVAGIVMLPLLLTGIAAGLAAFTLGLGLLGGAFTTLAFIISMNPLFFLVAALVAIVAAIWIFRDEIAAAMEWLWEKMEPIVEFFQGIIDGIVKVFEGLYEAIVAIIDTIVYVLNPANWGDIATKIIEIGASIVGWLIDGLGGFIDAVFYVLNPANWGDIATKIVEIGGDIIQWIIDGMAAVLQTILDWFVDLGKKIYDSILDGIKGIGKAIADAILGTGDLMLVFEAKIPELMAQTGLTEEEVRAELGLPALQHGGLFTSPTAAIVGDVPEAVIPLRGGNVPVHFTGTRGGEGGGVSLTMESGAIVIHAEGAQIDEDRLVSTIMDRFMRQMASRGAV